MDSIKSSSFSQPIHTSMQLLLLLPAFVFALASQALVLNPRDQTKNQYNNSTKPVCTNPSVRKEWRSVSKSEQMDWINAVKCLQQTPHDPSYNPPKDYPAFNKSASYYDDLVYQHLNLRHSVPFTAYSLPWHRWYEHLLETALKEKCGYKGAMHYWDYTRDAADYYNNTIFDKDTFGTWGDPNDDFQLKDGAFSADVFQVAYPSPHGVRRNYTLYADDGSMYNTTFSKDSIDKLLNDFNGDFKGFQHYIENGPHVGAHYITGGELAGSCNEGAIQTTNCKDDPLAPWSANDPVFWLQHVMVDNLWTTWQNQENNFWLFEGGSVFSTLFPNGGPPFLDITNTTLPGGGLVPDIPVSELLNTTGGYLCYVYE